MNSFGRIIMCLLLSGGLLCGCSPAENGGHAAEHPRASRVGEATGSQHAPDETGISYFPSPTDNRRLEALWQARTSVQPYSDFPLGPGDELSVIVPAIPELTDATVRISALGDIDLPLIGQIHAGGLSENQLRDEIRERLRKFMLHPRFQLAVKQFMSRQVAVLGAVKRPGVLPLYSPVETILDAIGLAGGPDDGAGDRVVLIPSSLGRLEQRERFQQAAQRTALQRPDESPLVAAGTPAIPDSYGAVAEIEPASQPNPDLHRSIGNLNLLPPWFQGSNAAPLVIGFRVDGNGGNNRFLNLPLRPGDIVYVPGGGQVSVVGWVYNPGAFKVTDGMSVKAAIAAAGGPLWAADVHDIVLSRNEGDGKTETIHVDWSKIQNGQERDIAVQANDVISVTYSEARLFPYTIYSLINSKFAGFAAPIPY